MNSVVHMLVGVLMYAGLGASLAWAEPAFPVTVNSCGKPLTFTQAPSRAVAHDINIAEMMFALELQHRMVGVTGITGWYKASPAFKQARGIIPELATKYPTMENLLGVDPDFFFAGWYYGMTPGGAVTPDTLGAYGIPTYVLTESCVHLDPKRPSAHMDLLYQDMLNLGKIFGQTALADQLVQSWKTRVTRVKVATQNLPRPRVFVFDSGEDKPFTAGKFAMPDALIEAAGGVNLLGDIAMSWGRVGWESVVERNPQFVIIVGYQDGSWRERWEFLQAFAPMTVTDAVQHNRVLVLDYSELTPGPANINAIEKLARALHPDAF